MAEIAYLVGQSGGATFLDAAADHYAGRPEVTVVDTATTLEAVLTDLRARATGGEVFRVVSLVCEDSGTLALPFPISEARRAVDGGRTTAGTLQAATLGAGTPGFPAVLGPPAVSEATSLWVHGPAIGQDVAFVTRLAQLFGPALTVHAPLVPELIGGALTRYRRTVVSGERTPSTQVLDDEPDPTPVEEPMSQLFGKYRATVVDHQDPEAVGRLLLDVPAASLTSVWAAASLPPIPVSLLQLPPAGADVWVEFEEGDPTRPIWTGATWHERPSGDLTLTSQGTVTIEADEGVTVRAGRDLAVSAGADLSMLAGAALTTESVAATTLRSFGDLSVSATGLVHTTAPNVKVDAVMADFSMTVKSAFLITDSVISASYSAGAGNMY